VSDTTIAVVLAIAGIALLCFAYLIRRGTGDLPPGYGAHGTGPVERRMWSGISAFLGVGCLVVPVLRLL
jgi:hypothetical protein